MTLRPPPVPPAPGKPMKDPPNSAAHVESGRGVLSVGVCHSPIASNRVTSSSSSIGSPPSIKSLISHGSIAGTPKSPQVAALQSPQVAALASPIAMSSPQPSPTHPSALPALDSSIRAQSSPNFGYQGRSPINVSGSWRRSPSELSVQTSSAGSGGLGSRPGSSLASSHNNSVRSFLSSTSLRDLHLTAVRSAGAQLGPRATGPVGAGRSQSVKGLQGQGALTGSLPAMARVGSDLEGSKTPSNVSSGTSLASGLSSLSGGPSLAAGSTASKLNSSIAEMFFQEEIPKMSEILVSRHMRRQGHGPASAASCSIEGLSQGTENGHDEEPHSGILSGLPTKAEESTEQTQPM